MSEEVRYTIDASDSTDPETTREIGVTISITPSLLPDGTIRMHMRPRTAQITENIEAHQAIFIRALARRRSSRLPEFLTDIR